MYLSVYFQFDTKKLGESEISDGFRNKLKEDLDNFQVKLSKTMQTYALCLSNYTNSMQSSLDAVDYHRQEEIIKLHQNTKSQSMTQVRK